MQQRLAEILSEVVEDSEVRYNYSGRGMYGEETTGLVVAGGLGTVLGAVLRNVEELAEEFEADEIAPGHFRTDSMGMDTIIY